MTIAETRARAAITRQLDSAVKNMVEDFTAASEANSDKSLSYQQNVTRALAKFDLKGAKPKESHIIDGTLWLVMEYSKSAANQQVAVNASDAAHELAIPALANMNAQDAMDKAFARKDTDKAPYSTADQTANN
jgi:hypothetical protein